MRQILQHLKTGELEVAEIPAPQPGSGEVLIQSRATLISPGTERMLVEFSRANLISKARQKPDKVRQVLDKIKADGLMPTLDAVFRKLDQPLPLGYCNAGVVLEAGPEVHDLNPGDRVVSNGPHAEIVSVPRNLCSKIPDGVSDEEAAFTVLGSIALQGLRLAKPELGEKFMVFGMGLIGLIAVQLLRANGCEVLAVDLKPERLKLAEEFGAGIVDLSSGGDPIAAAQEMTGGRGVDGVLVTASAKTDEIIHQAALACRKRGRIILVGVVGLNLQRSDFYEKEISFQVSCSYGPGRYDEKYEQGGRDYPYGFVRWTEERNFEAILDAMRENRLRVDNLVTDRFSISEAGAAYEKVASGPDSLGIILQYPGPVDRSGVVRLKDAAVRPSGRAVAGVIGAGNFANAVLLPALARTQARLAYVADLNGAAAREGARKCGGEQAVTDYRTILDDPEVNTIFITVGHHLHSRFVIESLQAGKNTFVEKPLAMNESELDEIISAYHSLANKPESQEKGHHSLATKPESEAKGGHSPLPTPHSLLVGFNRRFSPHTVKICNLLRGRSGPLCMNMTINAGAIPPDHWTQDPERGGGRIIGEGCHFIDLLSFLAGSPVKTVSAVMVGEGPAVRDDKTSIILGFVDGSIGTVNYFANGPKSYPKEMLEIFSDGRVIKMENFRRTRGYGFKDFRTFKTSRQDKGHRAEIAALIDLVEQGGRPLIPFDELINSTRASFAAVVSARENRMISL
jgi:predicted dehydrogenase/threonine dehydrogenase-like Zn-dependent dehydrogenase